jgi:hypothetical protein
MVKALAAVPYPYHMYHYLAHLGLCPNSWVLSVYV